MVHARTHARTTRHDNKANCCGTLTAGAAALNKALYTCIAFADGHCAMYRLYRSLLSSTLQLFFFYFHFRHSIYAAATIMRNWKIKKNYNVCSMNSSESKLDLHWLIAKNKQTNNNDNNTT